MFGRWTRAVEDTVMFLYNYIPSGIYPHRDFFGKFCSEILVLNENSKGIYIPLYPLFENFENFANCPAIYPGIYTGTSLYAPSRLVIVFEVSQINGVPNTPLVFPGFEISLHTN